MEHLQEVLRKTHVRFIVLAATALLLMTASSRVWAETQSIVGDPLEIYCGDTGLMALWFGGVAQYYGDGVGVDGDYDWGSVLMFDNGGVTEKYSDPYHSYVAEDEYGVALPIFTGVSNTKPGDGRIDTVLGAGDSGVSITQKVEYTDGRGYYKMTWTITNNSSTTYTNCKFIHGGDAYFADQDDAQSYWDETLGMVYLRNPEESGIMGFYGGLGSPADHYNGGDYWDGDILAIDGELDDLVNPEFIDAGYHLQWNRASLAPGATWVITAFEKWTEAGDVQVLAPADQAGAPGSTVDLVFAVQNFQDAEDTFDLEAASDLGWAVSLPDGDTVTLAAGESATIIVRVIVPAGTEELIDTITLTSTSQADDSVTNSDSVQVSNTEEEGTDNGGRHHDGSWCFITTAQSSSQSAGMLILLAGICMGLGLFTRRIRRNG